MHQFSIDDQLFFEILKFEIRGITVPFASRKKRERDKIQKQLEEKINCLEWPFIEQALEFFN